MTTSKQLSLVKGVEQMSLVAGFDELGLPTWMGLIPANQGIAAMAQRLVLQYSQAQTHFSGGVEAILVLAESAITAKTHTKQTLSALTSSRSYNQ